ncbi:hypothetical protein Tco_0907038 [Tanacetum coccineum]|uniref:Uncharacterized protein n=1 Tax=Tanacetum coccineum TaxID=301880 RepID=A0ABQ5CKF5_9ASTR
MEIIPDKEEVKIDAIPLAVKSPYIVDWKIHKEGRKSYYQIIRADGKSQMYMIFRYMLKSFDREDLETLYKLVKAKYKSIRPVEDLDLVLWNDLKTMFEPHVEDAVWRNQQDYKMLSWKLYDSYGGRTNAIDADDDITLVSVQDDADKEMFDVDALNVSTAVTTITITAAEITLAQALEALKTLKPKGKEIMIEPVKPMEKKDLIRLDEEVDLKLQAEFDKEERLAREKAEKEQEANITLIET